MFHGRLVNNKIDNLHEFPLCIVYKDRNSSFKTYLRRITHKNIQSLAIELFKIKENLLNTIMNDTLQTMTLTYNLMSETDFVRSSVVSA